MLGRLILASASPRRLDLLAQIGIVAAEVVAAEIEEVPRPGERPRELASRLAKAKADHVAELFPDDFVLNACIVVPLKRRQMLGPRRFCDKEHRQAQLGQYRQCGKTSARRSRR